MRRMLGAAVVVAALTLAGCGTRAVSPPAAGDNAPVAVAEGAPAQADAGLPASPPTEVEIPKIGAKSSLVSLDLNADGTVQVPPVSTPMQAGWYDKAPTPGETGPAVILGHVDGNKQPGILFRLKDVAKGDDVLVTRQDGRHLRFVVDRVEQVAKDAFPTDEVYGDTTGPELRLITCGGVFDHAAHSYKDNIVVFAKLTGS
ncbi:class F sortase [Kibdelosporangium lantanae]